MAIRSQLQRTSEFERISALPRRSIEWQKRFVHEVTKLMNDEFKLPHAKRELWPIQAYSLFELSEQRGLFSTLRVGGGKTLLAILARCMFPEVQKPLILVEPTLRDHFKRNLLDFSNDFRVPWDLVVKGYSELSTPGNHSLLHDIQPDMVVCDEAQNLRSVLNASAPTARGRRVREFAEANPDVIWVFLTGTLFGRSLKEFVHLVHWALRDKAPVPFYGYKREISNWCKALDILPKGEKRKFGARVIEQSWARPGEDAVSAFGRRLRDTAGFVSSPPVSAEDADMSLNVYPEHPKVPESVESALRRARGKGETFEDVEDLEDIGGTKRQISCGWYYVWDWPDSKVDWEWLGARAAWSKCVRSYLTASDFPAWDSEARFRGEIENRLEHLPDISRRVDEFIAQAAAEKQRELVAHFQGPSIDGLPYNYYASAVAWRHVKPRPAPPKKVIWIDDWLMDWAVAWAKKRKGSIIWWQYQAMGDALAARGLPTYGAGTDADLAKAPAITCSIDAQSRGKNLQHYYWRNLFLIFPGNGQLVEQVMGRTHRYGQVQPEVTLHWCAHTKELVEGYDVCLAETRHQHQVDKQPKKLLLATHGAVR